MADTGMHPDPLSNSFQLLTSLKLEIGNQDNECLQITCQQSQAGCKNDKKNLKERLYCSHSNGAAPLLELFIRADTLLIGESHFVTVV